MKNNFKNEWDFSLLYSSIDDERIDKDIQEIERLCTMFNSKYSVLDKNNFIKHENLIISLKDYFHIRSKLTPKPIVYLSLLLHKNSSNIKAQALLNKIISRITNATNNLNFYIINLGNISDSEKENILNSEILSKYRFFLRNVFLDAKHNLSEAEERIMSLKNLPASEMWDSGHDKILSSVMIKWKGKEIPLAQANSLIADSSKNDRYKLAKLITIELKKLSVFSEAEMNALVTNAKINDELRKYTKPYEATVDGYNNDLATVEKLVEIVSNNFSIAHRFHKIKAKLLKLKVLKYSDRNAKYANIDGNYSFNNSIKSLIKVFGNFDKKYSDILKKYLENGQIDVYPKKGKTGGAYCWGTFENPTFVLLNHVNSLHDYSTIAHEMGHAFHTELSKDQGPVYSSYSTSLAETASTFFESLAFESIIETLPDKQKIIALHNQINDDISTIFRQIACFNLEKDIHNHVRENGYVSKEELADLHNKNMKAYLGPAFKLEHDDGYFFVQWGHLRRFFYVYTYAYGQLVSSALLRRYKQDKSFIVSIEKFLIAGGKDTPENILKNIGIDVTTGELFQEGIEEILQKIIKLEKLVGM